jgi:hypothetical protein
MKRFATVAAATLFILAAVGCGREDKGPAEQAGQKIDETVEQAKEGMQEAADEAAEKVEEAGDKLRQSTND